MSFSSVSRYRYSTIIHEGTFTYFGPRPVYSTGLSVDDSYYIVRAGDDLPKIAAYALGDPRYWWVVADFNDTVDPFVDLVPGAELRVPSKRRLYLEILR